MMKTAKKQRLTDGRVLENDALKDIFNKKKKELNLTQAILAEKMEMSQGAINQYLNGFNPLNAQAASQFAQILHIPVSSFSERLAKEIDAMAHTLKSEPSNVGEQGEFVVWNRFSDLPKDEWALIPFYRDTKVSAGDGIAYQADNNHFRLPFSRATLNRLNINPDHVVCHNVLGKSMHPLLPEHTTIGINLNDTLIREGKIYAFKHKGLLKVKLLHPLSDSEVRIQSANSDKVSFPDDVANLADIEMLGRVFWWSVLD